MMKKLMCIIAMVLVYAGAPAAVETEETWAVFEGDGSRKLEVRLTSGRVFVRGVESDTVRVHAARMMTTEEMMEIVRKEEGMPGEEKDQPDPRAVGLKRLTHTATGLQLWAEGDVMRVTTGELSGSVELRIDAPRTVALDIKTDFADSVVVEGMDASVRIKSWHSVRVENVTGEIDVESTGWIYLDRVSGGVVASSRFGGIEGSITGLDPEKPISLSAMGLIDIALPPSVEASLHMKATWGEVYSGFPDMKVTPAVATPRQTVAVGRAVAEDRARRPQPSSTDKEEQPKKAGKGAAAPEALSSSRVTLDEAEAGELRRLALEDYEAAVLMSNLKRSHLRSTEALGNLGRGKTALKGEIGGGGAEIRMTTVHGNIYVRRGTKK